MPGKPISKSKNAGLAKLAKSGEKGKSLAKKIWIQSRKNGC